MPRIQVCVRLRPDPESSGVAVKEKNVLEVIPSKRTQQAVGSGPEFLRYKFDQVLDETTTQEDVFNSCGLPAVQDFFRGINNTILAYGQTGAGKTYTVMGPPGGDFGQRGLAPRMLSEVFQELDRRKERKDHVALHMSAFEIYNESVLDLLVDRRAGMPENLGIYELPDGTTYVHKLNIFEVHNEEEALRLLFRADMARVVGEHDLNADSTRSHCIYTLHLTMRTSTSSASEDDRTSAAEDANSDKPRQQQQQQQQIITAKLHLVDLAGSERIFRTGSTGLLQREAGYINQSLSFLEQVVIALTDEKREHIPYRQSKLTHYLKDSLGGNCKTLMVANVWPVPYHVDQTVSTLRFATRMMNIQNDPIVNRGAGGGMNSALVARLVKQIKELKEELAMRDRLYTAWGGRPMTATGSMPYPELTPDQLAAIQSQVSTFIADANQPPPVLTVAQIRATFIHMRQLIISSTAATSISTNHSSTTTSTTSTSTPPHGPRPAPQALPPSPAPPSTTSSPGVQRQEYTSPPIPKPRRPRPQHLNSSASPGENRRVGTSGNGGRVMKKDNEAAVAMESARGAAHGSSPSPSLGEPPRTPQLPNSNSDASFFKDTSLENLRSADGNTRTDGLVEARGGDDNHVDSERELAFADFRKTERGVHDASALKSIKLRLRQVKERLDEAESQAHSLRARVREVSLVTDGEELDDAERDLLKMEQQRDALRRQYEGLLEEKRGAVKRMVADFKCWWSEQQQQEASGAGLQLPPLSKHGGEEQGSPGPRRQAADGRGAVDGEQDGARDKSLSPGGRPRRPAAGVPGPTLSANATAAEVAYEVARHQTLGRRGLALVYHHHSEPSGVTPGRRGRHVRRHSANT